jgi:protein-tyrosine phosphatase
MTELPFDYPGKILRSVMPFGPYDPSGNIFEDYKFHGVSLVVLLAGDEECIAKTGFNLREFYEENGIEVHHLPIPDFNTPEPGPLLAAVDHLARHVESGKHAAVHCAAGIGRTGLVLAALARKSMGLSGNEAVNWVRKSIWGAVETNEQLQFLESLEFPA